MISFFVTFFCQAKEENNTTKVFRAKITLQNTPEEIPLQKKYANYSRLKTRVKEEIFHPIIIEASSRHSIDPALVKAIIMAESSYNPIAISKKGARGLMQLMPETASSLGVEDPFNPEHNINGGIKYMKKLLRQFKGELPLALAAYNAGSSKVRKYNGIPPFKATQHYVKNVLKYYKKYKEELNSTIINKA